MPEIILAEHHDIGGREIYEDRGLTRQVLTAGGLRLTLAVVADGFGSELRGERAAQLTVDTFIENVESSADSVVPRLLTRAIQAANHAVFAESRGSGAKPMSSTISAAALLDEKVLYVANVGDSRVYLCRKGKLTLLTVDHTFSTVMNWLGELAPSVSSGERRSGSLVRAIGQRERVIVDIGFYVGTTDPKTAMARGLRGLPLEPGDSILVCSNGLIRTSPVTHNPANDSQEIARALTTRNSPKAIEMLVAQAIERGVNDNVTAVLIQLPDSHKAAAEMRRRSLIVLGAIIFFVLLVVLVGLSFVPQVSIGPLAEIGKITRQGQASTLRTQEMINAGDTDLLAEAGNNRYYLQPQARANFTDKNGLNFLAGAFLASAAQDSVQIDLWSSRKLTVQTGCMAVSYLSPALVTASCYAGQCAVETAPITAGKRLLLEKTAGALETITIPPEEIQAFQQLLARTEQGKADLARCFPQLSSK